MKYPTENKSALYLLFSNINTLTIFVLNYYEIHSILQSIQIYPEIS